MVLSLTHHHDTQSLLSHGGTLPLLPQFVPSVADGEVLVVEATGNFP